MEAEELSELKDLIKLSRKRELNFAMCLGKTHKDLVLLMHRIKTQEVLMRKARKMDGAIPAKYTIGTVKSKGRRMTLTCEVEPPPGTARILRRFFIWADMPMQIILLDMSGGVVEADLDDEDAQAEDAAKTSAASAPRTAEAGARAAPGSAETTAKDPDPKGRAPKPEDAFAELDKARSDRIGEEGISKAMGKWRQARRLVGPKIVAYSKGRTPDAAGIGQSWDRAVKLGDRQNNPVEAYRMLERIVARIRAAKSKDPAAAAEGASKAKQMTAFKSLARKVRRRVEQGGSPQLRKDFVEAVRLAQRGDPGAALDLLEDATRTVGAR